MDNPVEDEEWSWEGTVGRSWEWLISMSYGQNEIEISLLTVSKEGVVSAVQGRDSGRPKTYPSQFPFSNRAPRRFEIPSRSSIYFFCTAGFISILTFLLCSLPNLFRQT